jgi:hypothetical protein
MKFFVAMCMVIAAVVVTGVEQIAQAQTTPAYASPSGCRTTTLKNTLLFTQMRTGNPGDRNIVLGAYTVTDDDPAVQDTGTIESANCVPGDVSDGHPTHVTVITVTLAGGDVSSADVRTVKLFLDGNEDGFLQEGQDTQLGTALPGTCLFSMCVFNLGRSTPLFTVNGAPSEENTDEGDGEPQDENNGDEEEEQADTPDPFQAFIITVDLGPNAQAGANLMINVAAEANDIVTRGPDSISSDFNDTYRNQTSNIILNSLSGGDAPFVQGINNGSGNPETGLQALELEGLLTRFREEKILPGAREAIAAVVYLCEGGSPVTPKAIILPAIAKSAPTLAGYPDVLACITSANPDQIGTRVLRLRVGITGNAGAVGTLRLYDDANDNGVLFEGGEYVLSASSAGGVAIFGSLNNPLLVSTRPNAEPAPGMYPAQTGPETTTCDSNETNPKPEGASKGCPHLLILTFDVNSNALPGEIHFDIALDVGNLPGEGTDSPTASSNLSTTASVRHTVTISAAEAPRPQKSIFRLIAEHSGEPNLIENEDIFWAMAQWAKNEPLVSDLYLKDSEMLQAVRFWSESEIIAASELSKTKHRTRLAGPMKVRQNLEISTVAPGESFVVTAQLETDKSARGLLFSQSLPAGWTITPLKNAGGVFNGESWLWLKTPGKSLLTYKITVPADAKNGIYTLGSFLQTALPEYETDRHQVTVAVLGKPIVLKLGAIHLQDGEFVVEGAGIRSTSVELFSLNGAFVTAETAESPRLTLQDFARLANGVYLYVLTVKGLDGKIIRKFNKLVIQH